MLLNQSFFLSFVFFLRLFSCHLLWEHYSLSKLDLKSYEKVVNSSISLRYGCILDSIHITWKTNLNPSSLLLSYVIDDENEVYSTVLSAYLLPNTTVPFNHIQCEINEEHCVVKVNQVYLREKKIFIDFDHPTNQPELLSSELVMVCLEQLMID